MRKEIVVTVVSVLGVFVFLYGVYYLVNRPNPEYPELKQLNPADHFKWSPAKKNVLIEYSDFQCPACKNFHDFLQQIESSNSADSSITKKITLVFRNYPLYQIHSNSMIAAQAAEAAGLQGKFWEMADQLWF